MEIFSSTFYLVRMNLVEILRSYETLKSYGLIQPLLDLGKQQFEKATLKENSFFFHAERNPNGGDDKFAS